MLSMHMLSISIHTSTTQWILHCNYSPAYEQITNSIAVCLNASTHSWNNLHFTDFVSCWISGGISLSWLLAKFNSARVEMEQRDSGNVSRWLSARFKLLRQLNLRIKVQKHDSVKSESRFDNANFKYPWTMYTLW